jgi:hypothetical protein
MKRISLFLRLFGRCFFAFFLFANAASPAFAQQRGDDGWSFVLGNISASVYTAILEGGFQPNFSLAYRYAPSTEGELRVRYTEQSYNGSLYDLEESLTANDEKTYEVFLLPFRYIFSYNSLLSLNAAAGAYYEHNALEQRGYFNHPDLAPDSLNMYNNEFSMSVLGPLLEGGLRFQTPVKDIDLGRLSFQARIADITLDAGIVPLFYLRRDQSTRMAPFMGNAYFNHSQDTSGSPYFYGKLGGAFFRYLNLSVLYQYARLDYDIIAINSDTGEWGTLQESFVSWSYKLEAFVLLPFGGDFGIRVGYGHSFDTIHLDSSTPVRNNNPYFFIGADKITL